MKKDSSKKKENHNKKEANNNHPKIQKYQGWRKQTPKKEKINDAAVESGSKEEGDSDNDKFGDDNLNEYNQDAFMVDEDKDEDDDGVRVS
mmetsp:Transcript_10671/g.19161  ORF Transcript_10671/g.19161 Transcript_10671/m.19161 type:complete len:90 (-) Transcript_10671:940-1209(-)